MYSVVYPELDFGKFSGMVPEWFRNPFWWIFGNGSGMVPEAFHVSPEDIFDEDPFPSASSAIIGVALSVVLIGYFEGRLSAWKIMSAEASGKYTYVFRRKLEERINICSRRYNLPSGYDGDRILSCGGW